MPPSEVTTAGPVSTTAPLRVLVIGVGQIAARYLRALGPAWEQGRVEGMACDIADRAGAAAPFPFRRLPPGWHEHPAAPPPLDRAWDLVLVLTPLQHAAVARAAARAMLRHERPATILIEKPVETEPSLAAELLDWLRRADPGGRITLRVIDHYRHKWAVRQMREHLRGLDLAALTRAAFASYEPKPITDSPAYAPGYLVEHGCHGLAALDLVCGVRSCTPEPGSLAAATHAGAPGAVNTWASLALWVGTEEPAGDVPFVLSVGKGLGTTSEKWLRLDGRAGGGEEVTVWADIDRKRLYWRAAGRGVQRRESDEPDGYAVLVPDLLRGREALLAATVSLGAATAWLEPLWEASRSLVPPLPEYGVGEMPAAAGERLAQVLRGLPTPRE